MEGADRDEVAKLQSAAEHARVARTQMRQQNVKQRLTNAVRSSRRIPHESRERRAF